MDSEHTQKKTKRNRAQDIASLVGTGLLLLVLPLLFSRGFTEPFSYPKTLLTKGVLLLSVAIYALGRIWGKAAFARDAKLVAPLVFLVFAVLLSCWNSCAVFFSLREAEYFLCGPMWGLLLVAWDREGRLVKWTMGLIAVAASLVALIAVTQWVGFDPILLGGYSVNWGTMVARMRLYSTLGNPNFVAGYLIGAFFILLTLARLASTKTMRYAAWLGLIAVLAAVVGTGSRGGWAGIMAGLVVYAVMRRLLTPSFFAKEARDKGGGSAVVGLVLFLVVIGMTIFSLGEPTFNRFESRVYLWRVSWPMFVAHPLFGSGWSTFQLHFLELQARFLNEYPEFLRYWSYIRQLHNDPLQLLLETGAVGFTSFAWLLWRYGTAVRKVLGRSEGNTVRPWMAASAGGVTAILVDSLFNFQFAVPPTLVLLFTLLALPEMCPNIRQEKNFSAGAAVVATQQESFQMAVVGKQTPVHQLFWRRALQVLVSLLIVVSVAYSFSVLGRRAAAEHLYAKGFRAERRGEWLIAAQSYQQGRRFALDNDRLHFGLARVLYYHEHFPEALAEVLQAERTYRDSRLELLKGRILERMGQHQLASAAFRRAEYLDPRLETAGPDGERQQ